MRRTAGQNSRSPFITLIPIAAAERLFRFARLVNFLRMADIVHVLEVPSSGALVVRAGFRTAHEMPFGCWSGALGASACRTLLRHVLLRSVECSLGFTTPIPPLRQQNRARYRRAQSELRPWRRSRWSER